MSEGEAAGAETIVDSKLELHLRQSYGVLAVAIFVVVLASLFYWWSFEVAVSGWFVVTMGVLALVIFFCFVAQHPRTEFGFRTYSVPPLVRKRALPLVALVFLVALGVIIRATGGGPASPFSHLLTAVGSLSVVFAKELRNRTLLAFAIVLVYAASTTQSARWLRWQFEVGDWSAVADLILLVVATALVFATAEKTDEKESSTS